MPYGRHIKLCRCYVRVEEGVSSHMGSEHLEARGEVMDHVSPTPTVLTSYKDGTSMRFLGARMGSWCLVLLGLALSPLLPLCAAEAEAVSVDAVTSAVVLEGDPVSAQYGLHFSERELQKRVQLLESISDEIRLDNTAYDTLTAEDLLDSINGSENDGLFVGKNANDVRQDTKKMAEAAAAQNTPLVDPVTGYDSANYHVFNPKFAIKSWITDPAFSGFAGYFLQPADYGQSYIGKITLEEYAEAWRHYIADMPVNRKCYVFSSKHRFTVYGKDCLEVHNLERIEARANKEGMLNSVVLVQHLGDQIPTVVMLDFLSQRYKQIQPQHSPMQHLALLAGDLCTLSSLLSQDRYKCTLNWFSTASDVFMLYKQSRYNGSNIATIMFGDEQYFNNVQLPLVKKRLATIRQRLGQIGVEDPTERQPNQ